MSAKRAPSLGSLRERVELKQNTQTMDAAGGHSDNYVSLGQVWARISASNGALDVSGDARNAKINFEIIIRFRDDLKPGDQIIYRSEKLEIISLADLNGRRAYLQIICSQISIAG